ncbi:MAG: hypothetical protein ACYTHM_13555 [Planctomycetota bacterium]|jgi:hypothetical protein
MWKYRPSAGFILLFGSVLALALFFLWGLRVPELDRVWHILHELKIGRTQRLTPSELVLLRRTLARYPNLGPSLLDDRPAGLISAHTGGWVETERAILLAHPEAGRDPLVTIHWRPEPDQLQGPVVFDAGGGRTVNVLKGPGSVTLGIPKSLRDGRLIEVRLGVPEGEEGEGLTAGLQIVFPEWEKE